MKIYVLLFFLCIQISCIQATVVFAELHKPDGYLTVQDALFEQGLDTQRTRARAALKNDIEVISNEPQEGLHKEELHPPDVVYPSYSDYQRDIWHMQQQAAIQQHAAWQQYWWQQWQHSMIAAAAIHPPMSLHEKLVYEKPPPPIATPAPKQQKVGAKDTHSQGSQLPQNVQLRITSEHTETEAILPATLTQAQKDLINALVAQQLAAEREQLHVENARITQQEHTAQRQHTQRMVIVAIGGLFVFTIIWGWSGRKCLIILREILLEGYNKMKL